MRSVLHSLLMALALLAVQVHAQETDDGQTQSGYDDIAEFGIRAILTL